MKFRLPDGIIFLVQERMPFMIKDYHIHPQIITNNELFEKIVDTALANGIEEICITDHMPLTCSSASDRIPHGKVRDYCRRGRELAEEYSDRISVKLGIEADYHPSAIGELEAVLSEGDFDFVLGSSHLHVFSHLGFFDGKLSYGDYAELMYENTASAAASGYFDAIAHVDMYRWIFTKHERFPLIDDGFCVEDHTASIKEMLCAIKNNGLRLEINPHFASHTLDLNKVYPCDLITQAALDMGIKFSFGSDAHKAEDVGKMLDMLRCHPLYGKAIKTWEEDI